jgi:type IV secretion system protein TrbL
MVAEITWGFIQSVSAAINGVIPYTWKVLYALTVLNITWLGIETMLGKYTFEKLLETVLVLGISVFLVKNLGYLSHLFLSSLVKLSGVTTGMDTSVLENPSIIFDFAHTGIIYPLARLTEEYMGGAVGPFDAVARVFNNISFYALYGLALLAVYVCFAVVVVQIVLNYLLYHIVLFFGYVLLPFTVFRPLDFIGKNVFKAVLTQALTCAVIVFVASIGLGVFRLLFEKAFLVSMSPEQFARTGGGLFLTVIACVLLYCFLCLQAPTLVMSVISGAPTLGAGGLFSTAAAIGGAVMGAAAVIGGAVTGAAGGGGGGGTAPAGAALPGSGAGGELLPALPSSSGSLPPVNTLASSPALPPPAAANPFLPAPARPQLEDKTAAAPAAAGNAGDDGFSYRVVS